MIKKGFSYIGIFFLYFLSLFPISVLYVLASLSYYLLYYIIGYRRKVVRENLVNSFPEKNSTEIIEIEKQYYRFLSTMIFEIIKMTSVTVEELTKRIKFNNLERIKAYTDRGESILACSSHYCNWEWGMLALSIHVPVKGHVIYKPLNNPVFEKWFYKMRSKFGNKLVPMRQTLRAIAATRKETTMFCFAGDQTPVKDEARYWINFLHQPTAVLTGVEKIALQTNRPVFYLNMKWVKRGHYEVDCELLCADPSQTKDHQIINRNFNFLENIINEAPAYWLWSHRRWKHKPGTQE